MERSLIIRAVLLRANKLIAVAIDLIRQAQQLASKPSQLISAKRWAVGFAAVITGAVWQQARYLPSSRSIKRIQRLPIGLCSANQSTSLLSIGTHVIDLIRIFAIEGLISMFWEEHGKIDRRAEGIWSLIELSIGGQLPELHQASNRWLNLKAGMIHGRVPSGPGRMAGRGQTRASSPESDIPCQYSAALLKILVGLGSKKLALGYVTKTFQNLAAAFPENSGLPSLKPFRLGDLSSHWNALRWPSAALVWLRGGW
jgi:hypothetical protein